jgi:tRNA (guanine37-N1)-methyltransferase
VELRDARRIVALTPSGRVLDESVVADLAREPALTLLSGRYEGFDERILEHFATDQISIGRYVLAGGELPAMVVCDTLIRRLPGALGHEDSAVEESFSSALEGAPEYPHYTRPAEYRGWQVPEVLLSGHHARIREWRLEQSRARRDG